MKSDILEFIITNIKLFNKIRYNPPKNAPPKKKWSFPISIFYGY